MNNTIIEILAKIFGDNVYSLELAQMNPSYIKEWNSTNHINLIVNIEDELGVFFESEEVTEAFGGFQKIIEILNKK